MHMCRYAMALQIDASVNYFNCSVQSRKKGTSSIVRCSQEIWDLFKARTIAVSLQKLTDATEVHNHEVDEMCHFTV